MYMYIYTSIYIYSSTRFSWWVGQSSPHRPSPAHRGPTGKKRNRSHTQTHNKNNTTQHTTRQEQHHKGLTRGLGGGTVNPFYIG